MLILLRILVLHLQIWISVFPPSFPSANKITLFFSQEYGTFRLLASFFLFRMRCSPWPASARLCGRARSPAWSPDTGTLLPAKFPAVNRAGVPCAIHVHNTREHEREVGSAGPGCCHYPWSHCSLRERKLSPGEERIGRCTDYMTNNHWGPPFILCDLWLLRHFISLGGRCVPAALGWVSAFL